GWFFFRGKSQIAVERKMSVNLDLAKDNANFLQTFRLIIVGNVILGMISLSTSTYSVLSGTSAFMHDWRGITCILLTCGALLVYGFSIFNIYKLDWPLPLPYAIFMWGAFYLIVLGLVLIANSNFWNLYIVFGYSFAMFEKR